ncbi:MAG: serine/threonine protein kinase [Deltaproteobacteria bacterium]|nr:serine/threonine protein kinase [Deltaproteobacteria bacterium]MCW5807942.1 serine/threonine protein kinase [Deltaproteobacteria bacterium]
MSAQPADRIGQVIGDRFRLDALIGKGAMAHVYRALDQKTSAYVAIKILKLAFDGDPSAHQRFAREADVQERVRHHNVAALLESGVTQFGEPFLALELLRGKTLRTVIRDEKCVHPLRAASYAYQALQGLGAVHDAGILHRDLKPANIMLEPSPGPIDRVVVIDFGFATFEGSAKLTAQGAVVGSLRYIAPERLRGEDIDHRSDVYSIGIILYELLTGAPPFVAASDMDLVEMHLHDIPDLGPVPAQLNDILQIALAKDQDDRYSTAGEMASALEGVAHELA